MLVKCWTSSITLLNLVLNVDDNLYCEKPKRTKPSGWNTQLQDASFNIIKDKGYETKNYSADLV